MRGTALALSTFLILLSSTGAHAQILQWSNSLTGDASTVIQASEGTGITFHVWINGTSNVTWLLNGTEARTDVNVTNSSFTANLSRAGVYLIVALAGAHNVTWSVSVYEPVKITGYYNNVTGSNDSRVELELGKSIELHVNTSGTVASELWRVSGASGSYEAGGGSTFVFSPERYGEYTISYTAYGVNSTAGVSWNISVYLEVKDALNTTLRFYSAPERIVSLAPSITEILFAVNMSSALVGVDDYSDYPPEISNMSVERVGGPYSGISVERIVNLTPDLVISARINPLPVIEQLRSLNITVLATKSDSIDEVLRNILLIGRIGGRQDAAERLVQNLSSRIERVRSFSGALDDRRKPTIFYVVWYPELWTPGKGTYASDLIALAGGKNAGEDGSGWYIMSREVLLSKDPDVIVCSGMGGYGATVCSQIRNDSVLSKLKAVRSGRMYVIPDSSIVERPGPRIVDGLEFFYEVVRENLRPLPAPQPGGGSGGGSLPAAPALGEVFGKRVQEYGEVKSRLAGFMRHRTAYSADMAEVVPLLLSGRYPDIGLSGRVVGLEVPDPYTYSARVAVSRYFFAREVIIARGDLPVDAYAALCLAKRRRAPVLYVEPGKVPEAVEDAIKKIKPKKILIVGGRKAVSGEVEEELRGYAEVERVWGETRVETSIEVARRTGAGEVVVTHYNSSVEAAVLSYLYGAPVVYVSEHGLERVVEFLRERKPRVLFVGVDEGMKKRILDEIA